MHTFRSSGERVKENSRGPHGIGVTFQMKSTPYTGRMQTRNKDSVDGLFSA